MDPKPEVCRATQIPKNPLDKLVMAIPRRVHEQAALLDNIGEVGAR